tara:strand:- start:2046 stop:2312 length:267 start_codon:yes stop_codon:yes gene_type:complete
MSYLANRGERKEFFLKLTGRMDKGEYSIHNLIDRKGRKAMFYRCSGDIPFEKNDCILVKATVAEHREYKDEPQTYLNRVKILRNVGAK